jgi:hypothetical protein
MVSFAGVVGFLRKRAAYPVIAPVIALGCARCVWASSFAASACA